MSAYDVPLVKTGRGTEETDSQPDVRKFNSEQDKGGLRGMGKPSDLFWGRIPVTARIKPFGDSGALE
mgnify:FL=1